MKRTTKQPRKAQKTSLRLGLLAAVSGLALGGAVTSLTAQSAGDITESGGYATAGIPVQNNGYANQSPGIAPVGVGPATAYGAQSVGQSRIPTLGAPVRRGRWTTSVSPFVEGSVTYSDNINLDSAGLEQSETVLTVGGGVVLGAQSDRVTGQLTLRADYDTFLENTNDDNVRLNADTSWSAAVVPNLFYVDIGGGISEFYETGDTDFSGNPVSNSDNRSRAYYGLISPSLRKNIGGWANAELRYTGRAQIFDENDLEGGYSNTFSAALTGDPRKFRRFGWQAVTEYEVFTPENDTDEDINRWTSYVSLDVPVSRSFSVTATAGYDAFSNDVADDDLSGAYGNVGVRWQPTTRVAARAFAGWRYDGLDYGAEASYALRENLVAGISARRGVQFSNFGNDFVSPIGLGTDNRGRPTFVSNDGRGTTTDIDQALAVDNRTGQSGRFSDLNRNSQDDDAIVDTIQAYVAGESGRTSWNANVQAAKYDYGAAFGVDETIIAANVGLTRGLTSRLSMDLGAGYTSVQSEDPAPGSVLTQGDFETLSLGVGLDYQLTEIVNVFGRYTYTTRFADDALDEFDENAVVIGARASF